MKHTEKNKSFFTTKVIVIGLVILCLVCAAGCIYWQDAEQKQLPFETTYTFGDTPIKVFAKYDSKFKHINVGMEIQQKVEQWQIDEIGSYNADFTLTNTSANGTQKDFNFYKVQLIVGDNIRCVQSSQGTLDEFVQTKEILSGNNPVINSPKELELNSIKREKMKRVHFQQIEEEKRRRAIESVAVNKDSPNTEPSLGFMFGL